MGKPILFVGVSGHLTPEVAVSLRSQFERELPEYRVMVVGGLTAAIVLPVPEVEE